MAPSSLVPLSLSTPQVGVCLLEKDPRRRWRDMGDVRIELENLTVKDEPTQTGPCGRGNARELFHRNGDQMLAVRVSGDDEPVLSGPELLVEEPFQQRFDFAEYDVAADGRFLMIRQPDLTRIHVVLNWQDELTRLVPTDD